MTVQWWCQCPQRASTHFYFVKSLQEFFNPCVNALNGLLLISTILLETRKTNLESVNALNGLLLISTFKIAINNLSSNCVNALNGLLLISTQFIRKKKFLPKVSMPSTGFYSFLLYKRLREHELSRMCQCPQRASTHFYGSLSEALILLASES